ncbi:hypothetical protein [Edaphovirga cremea]|uniref:hypothetical protein n=1 Tax=Edaphovirga cremea TaxID=2267246 RepID=UPI000DEFA8CA|nr:hypothetical protein [Edaphovirga cremea]
MKYDGVATDVLLKENSTKLMYFFISILAFELIGLAFNRLLSPRITTDILAVISFFLATLLGVLAYRQITFPKRLQKKYKREVPEEKSTHIFLVIKYVIAILTITKFNVTFICDIIARW